MADEYNRLAMYASPVAPVENRLAQAVLPQGHPSNMLMWLRDQIPQVQADDTSTMSGITSRLGRTATAIPRAGLETMSNWLRGTHDPNAVRIGEDTIAPLGLFGMAGIAARAPKAAAAADRVWHHGTDAQFDTLQARAAPPYSGGSTVPAVWMTSKPRVAKAFAEAGGQPGRVIDANVNAPNLEVVERGFRSPDWETMDPILQRAKEAGKDGVLFKRSNDHPDSTVVDPRFWNASDVLAMFNPENIRPAQAAPRSPVLLSDNARSSVPGTVVNAMGEQPQTIRAYHGTNARFDKFDPSKTNEAGFHFGTEPQANARRESHGSDGWFSRWRNIPVDIEASRILDLKGDPGWFGGTALARHLHKEGVMPEEVVTKVRQMEAKDLNGANKYIREWLVDKGYDLVRYPNRVEGGGEHSYMALGTGNVRNADTGKVMFSDGATSSAPGLAASASQQPDNAVLDILTRYGLY
jgi:hypothetical protein